MDYQPQPIDTSKILLGPDLVELTEFLARNTHEVWARGRITEGWRYGPRRDDADRLHPGLVAYSQLTEGEKQFDRDTALETLKLILASGYRIEPPAHVANRQGVDAAPVNAKSLSLVQLLDLWQSWSRADGAGQPRHAPEAFAALGERALKLGEYLLAYDILKAGLRVSPAHVRLRQLQAVALARSGAAEQAAAMLEALREEGHQDENTLSGLGRTYKDLWQAEPDPAKQRRLLERAFEQYDLAYRLNPGGYYGAINAATLAACLALSGRAAELAAAAESACRRELERAPEGDDAYWPLATLGEAALVRRDLHAAADWYSRAAAAARGQFGNLSTTRRNARLLLRALGADESLVNRWLPLPRVVVFAGHAIDRPGRPSPRFPAELEARVAAEIRSRLDALGAGFGYASAACGADILFLEAMADRGGEANIVLPYDADRFARDHVAVIPGADWEGRFRRLLARPGSRVVIASEGVAQGDGGAGVSDEYASAFTFGLAGIRAWQLGAELAPLAVWDNRPGDSPGGTETAVARWRAAGCEPAVIALRDILRRERPDPAEPADVPHVPTSPRPHGPAPHASRMMAMLFADVVGFSKLTEDEMPLFLRHFLQPVAALADRSPHRPVQRNTWGDGLYFVFERVTDAGLFALELRDLVAATRWTALGFRRELSLRTGLHVGPVYECTNPVTARRDYLGTHVSRAARIEPITPSGQVYASEVFAAIAFSERPAGRAAGFTCEYVGRIGMAKNYGDFPTYHVRRTGRP